MQLDLLEAELLTSHKRADELDLENENLTAEVGDGFDNVLCFFVSWLRRRRTS